MKFKRNRKAEKIYWIFMYICIIILGVEAGIWCYEHEITNIFLLPLTFICGFNWWKCGQ